jgi:hypothetical protein
VNALKAISEMFQAITEVLQVVASDAVAGQKRFEAKNTLESICTFDFAFCLTLM